MQFAIDEVVDERYIVRSLHYRSGTGETYRAVDRISGDVVLLKVPRQRMAGDIAAFKHLRREIDMGARLQHPGLLRLLSVPAGRGVRWPYLVMEYVEGETLRSHLQDVGRLSIDEVLRIGAQLAVVLSYVHQQGIVYRQLMPDNILVSVDGRLKLTDLCIAHYLGPPQLIMSQLPSMTESFDYMAPEQLRGKVGDARTDVFALGVVPYELLAGRVPYHTDGGGEVMHDGFEADPPLLRRQRADVPGPLEALIYHAIRQHPTERHQSMSELHDDLVHADTAAIPVHVRAVPPPRWLPDLPALQLTVIVVLFLLLAVLAALAEFAHRVLPQR